MKTKPYRIMHKPTGLYYQPSHDGTNLSTKGKVYLTKTNPLSMYGGTDYIWVHINQRSKVFKKYQDILITNHWHTHEYSIQIPKSEFEQEFLEL